MDMKAKIEEILRKIKNDPDFSKKFTENPVKAAEELIGVDLPEEEIMTIINSVKAKIKMDNLAETANKFSSLLGGRKK